MYNPSFDKNREIEEVIRTIDRQIEYEKRKAYDYFNSRPFGVDDYSQEDRYHHKIDMLEEEKRRLIERIMAESYHQQEPVLKKKKDIVKDEIADAIDKFYEKEGLSKNDEVDIIVRKVGKVYVATVDKRRDQKIKEILED